MFTSRRAEGEARRGEARRDEARRGEARQGEARRGRDKLFCLTQPEAELWGAGKQIPDTEGLIWILVTPRGRLADLGASVIHGYQILVVASVSMVTLIHLNYVIKPKLVSATTSSLHCEKRNVLFKL
ncbi:hypothetical protein E2C01_035080 [Portunus trituberculatus]|uniref:Uncharacterized protein n=1 Tax=Portunus trituberculatus TaxID=210409 RepID=A0A5B7F862_PORTR|nr:hypothetical protein [Portunus trituberculatus]